MSLDPIQKTVSLKLTPIPSEGCSGPREQEKLAAFQKAQELKLLPPGDSEDPVAFPAWFRAYLRKNLPQLPTKGRPQYPRQATALLRWMQEHPCFTEKELAVKVRLLKPSVAATVQENERRAKYPQEWEVPVPEGTKLSRLRGILDEQFSQLPSSDLEDTSPLPIWFRVYLRKMMPGLSTSGPYQYPRVANRILRKLLDNPDSIELERLMEATPSKAPGKGSGQGANSSGTGVSVPQRRNPHEAHFRFDPGCSAGIAFSSPSFATAEAADG